MNAEAASLIEGAAEALCRKDLDAFLAAHVPDAEIFPLIASVEGGSYQREDGLRRFWEELHGAFDDWCPRPEYVRPVADAVVARVHLEARGKESDVPIDRVVWLAAATSADKLSWWCIHTSEDEAIATAERGGPRTGHGPLTGHGP